MEAEKRMSDGGDLVQSLHIVVAIFGVRGDVIIVVDQMNTSRGYV